MAAAPLFGTSGACSSDWSTTCIPVMLKSRPNLAADEPTAFLSGCRRVKFTPTTAKERSRIACGRKSPTLRSTVATRCLGGMFFFMTRLQLRGKRLDWQGARRRTATRGGSTPRRPCAATTCQFAGGVGDRFNESTTRMGALTLQALDTEAEHSNATHFHAHAVGGWGAVGGDF